MSFIAPALKLGARDFSAGFLDSPERDTLPEGATPDARNCFPGSVEIGGRRHATLRRIPGSRLVTPSAMRTVEGVPLACDGLIVFAREAGPSQLLGKWGDAWYLFDEINGFTAIAGATGYTPGNPGRAILFKNQAFLHDGTKQQLWDGTTVRDVGFARPTAVTALTVGASPGVTGTYSARYTWYDQLHNHEGSPATGATPSQVFTNQKRTHTQPSGTPPAQVTHWRAYVRREDTSEAYWMRVATVPISDVTYTEAVVDGARVDALPPENENDPPTVTFKVMVAWKGFVFGFPEDSSDLHVCKQGDIESWDPRNVFKVSPGDGKGVRAALVFGTYCVFMKPTRKFYPEGSRLPFEIRDLDPDFGCVSAEAATPAGGWLYAWDAEKGPYRTDLNSWEELADFRIANTLKRVSKAALGHVRVVHDKTNSLVIWSVPTEYVGRNRVLLPYHYGLEAWLPPITGLEYGALAYYTPNNGNAGVFMGDLWGRVHRLFETNRQSVPAGTVRGTVTSATSSTLTDTGASFYTTGAGLAGLPVAVRSPAGVWQWRRIRSNTATELTLDTTYDVAWSAVPASTGWYYLVGGIYWYWLSGVLDGGDSGTKKRGHWLEMLWKPGGDTHAIDVVLRFNEGEGPTARDVSLTAETGGALWGSAVWGVSRWSGVVRRSRKTRVGRAFRAVEIGLSNFEPDQAIEITALTLGADWLGRGKARSARA